MHKQRFFRTSMGALAIAVAGAAHGQATIKEAIEQAFKTSPDIQLDVARRTSSDAALQRARAGFLPRVDLNLGFGTERSNNSTTRTVVGGSRTLTRQERAITLSQMLFDGAATDAEVNRNLAIVNSSAYRLAGTSEQTALKVAEHYLEVLRLTDLVALTKENQAAHEKTNDQITLRANSGVGRRADQDQSEARLALARANLIASEANLRDAEINFKRYVGSLPQNLGKPAEPAESELPKRVEEAVTTAINNSPLRKQAKSDVEQAIAQNKAAKAVLAPRFDLEAGITRNDNIGGIPGGNDTTYAMLRMRYAIFNGGADRARVDDTAAQVVQAEEIVRRSEYELEQNARLSWNAFRSATERLPSLKQHAESAFATKDAYGKQFSIGQRTLLDLLDTENEYFTAQSNYLNGRYTALFARYRILADTSKLLDTLGVKLPPATMITTR
jgi:adhesin transport system outer membrane protein